MVDKKANSVEDDSAKPSGPVLTDQQHNLLVEVLNQDTSASETVLSPEGDHLLPQENKPNQYSQVEQQVSNQGEVSETNVSNEDTEPGNVSQLGVIEHSGVSPEKNEIVILNPEPIDTNQNTNNENIESHEPNQHSQVEQQASNQGEVSETNVSNEETEPGNVSQLEVIEHSGVSPEKNEIVILNPEPIDTNQNTNNENIESHDPNQHSQVEQRISNQEDQLHQVDKKVTKIAGEIKEIYQLLKSVLSIPEQTLMYEIGRLVVDTLIKEKTSQTEEEDIQNFETLQNEICQWIESSKKLLNEIDLALPVCFAKLSESQQIQQSLPIQLKEKLINRQEGLDLIGRMLNRLPEQAKLKGISEEESLEKLPQLNFYNLIDILANETNLESVETILQSQITNIENQRWQIVTKNRNIAEKYKYGKRFLDFVREKLLPIVDAINSGELNSQSVLEEINNEYPELVNEYPELVEDLNNWLTTYSFLHEHLLKLLAQVGVQPMDIQIGTQVDYNCHEPLDTEPDSSLPNEHIKKVTRQGYQYGSGTSVQKVLRVAQVVVVKN